MTQKQTIKSLRDAILVADNALQTAKALLQELGGNISEQISFSTQGLDVYEESDLLIIEGVFTGESMLGSDGNTYPVPQNYASKSLLVQGSKLKAIIQPSGKITYKIIGEIPFETQLGILTQSGERYQVTTEQKVYNVLVAAVTYHKCAIGDTVRIRIPKGKEATYATIEHIVPKK